MIKMTNEKKGSIISKNQHGDSFLTRSESVKSRKFSDPTPVVPIKWSVLAIKCSY